ncbi:DUF928 domain-containing protein [Fischerella thermalis]|nr:DUF928 domain-containing protein [Fischerella thermalis]
MSKSKCALTIACMLLGWMSYFLPVIAQPNQPTNNNSQTTQIQFQDKEPDGSSRGRPIKRKGTGSRGDCPPVDVLTTALIPEKNVGLTVDESPSFWFFVPYKQTDIPMGEFVLQDETNNDIYRTNFTLPNTPGFVSLSLPSTVALAVNKDYQWYFKLYCSKQQLSNPIFVRGWVQRIPLKPELASLLKSATTPRQRIAIYAEKGIWYSALSELAELRLAETNNPIFANDWANLLQYIGLADFASKPIVGEVTEVK